MRIGIDFHSAEREGTGNSSYIRYLVEALLALNRDHEYFLYITDPSCPYYQTLPRQSNIRLRPLSAKHALGRLPSLGLKTLADKVDILHVQYVAPPVHGGNLIVTAHDISFDRCPDQFSPARRMYLKMLVPFSLRKARRVITISEFSRKDISDRYPAAAPKIHTTHLAAGPEFRPERGRLERQNVFRTLGIRGKYLLFVGRLDLRKNIAALIRAFSFLKKTEGIPHQLVIAGRKDYLPTPLKEEISADDMGKHVVFTGFVPEELLPTLYSQAEVFVYPSLYEGFGLPVVEAMACGCPVIAADTTALPEVVGSAGLLVAPDQPEGLAEAIHRVISDEALREKMRRDGLAQSRKFSWSETARKTMAVYEDAAPRPRGNITEGRIPNRS